MQIRDLSIRASVSRVSGAGLKINKSSEVLVERLFITAQFTGIELDNAHFTKLEDIRIANGVANGYGVLVTGDGGSTASLEQYFKRVFVDGNATPAAAPAWGFLIEDNQALLMEECN